MRATRLKTRRRNRKPTHMVPTERCEFYGKFDDCPACSHYKQDAEAGVWYCDRDAGSCDDPIEIEPVMPWE